MKIGISSLQGDYSNHAQALRGLGVPFVFVNRASQLAEVDGLILPGGESTTMLKLLDDERLFEPLVNFARSRPIFGTCAGTILLAREVTAPAQRSLGVIDIGVERNGYGRQLDSSIRLIDPSAEFEQVAGAGPLEAVFIRAPIIRRLGEGVQVLVWDGDCPVLVEQGHHLTATFHPELTDDRRIHKLFVEKVRQSLT